MMIDPVLDVTHRVSRYFRSLNEQRDEQPRVPPFSLLLDGATADLYRNYAFPDDGADPDQATVSELIAAFERNGRTPRLEYVPALAPALEGQLAGTGFIREGELPLMRCTIESLRNAELPEWAEADLATTRGALREAAHVQNVAYGAGPARDADVDRLERLLQRGGFVALVRRKGGDAIGSALVSEPKEGVAEIAALGVLEEERRQGIGAAVTALLAREALSRGIDLPFLMAAHETEARNYRRIGFETFATMLHLVRDGP